MGQAPLYLFFFQAEDGIRDVAVTGVQTCALPIYLPAGPYMVGLEGFVGDSVSSFQQLTVTIVAGQTARPMIALQPFWTVIDSMPTYTTSGQTFTVLFEKVAVATSYVVQKDSFATFVTSHDTTVRSHKSRKGILLHHIARSNRDLFEQNGECLPARRVSRHRVDHGPERLERYHGPRRLPGDDRNGELLEAAHGRSEEHTSELQSRLHLVCRLLLEKKKKKEKYKQNKHEHKQT